MEDMSNDTSKGTVLLTMWAAKNLKWDDVAVKRNETSLALVKKDSEAARGKRMCVSGLIIQIQVEKLDTGKIAEGLLMTYDQSLIHFAAAGSSGDLVERSSTRLCGVVTGRYEYSNSGGGTGHAVQIVGMFDLSENHPSSGGRKSHPVADSY
jgi:hypothetical protein